ncbi:MAG TPA: Gfo/Idh/MocA family oxidoreductase [Candidatus Eremiobacteraceae bacterium]|jgi:predicted dehydrogenase|nr:Gfo/Idh/MocA family oxidoreductase [Candidatus Eremiobacteraceae bacterium]
MKSNYTRRQFLQRTAATAGALAAANAIALPDHRLEAASYPANVPPSDRLRFGIIGIGMEGSGVLSNAIALPGVECVAAADLYDERHLLAREITGKPNLFTTRKYKELLDNKEIDCILAAVPDHWHKQVVVDSVRAGKPIYCEKPMSHTAADGVEMVAAAKETGKIVQIGSQRVSSVICAKAREILAQGTIGTLTLVEGTYGRNDPNGAWEYPTPPGLSPQNFDWETWQGTVPKRAWDPDMSPKYFARWRCWKEYGTGVAGDLLVHLVSGMMFMLGINEQPNRVQALGNIIRWKDGRNMPDVHAALYEYPSLQAPVYLRLNLGGASPETYRFYGSKGTLEVTENDIKYSPQTGENDSPSYYTGSFPHAMREAYAKQWHEENDPKPGKEPTLEGFTYTGTSWDELKPHLWNFFQAVRSNGTVTEDAVFGHHAALACHMANESYFRHAPTTWDAATNTIKS